MLPPARVADFDKFYTAALDEAKRTYSLEPVDDVLKQWRQIAIWSVANAAASQQTRQDFQWAAPGAQRWSDDYQTSTHTRLDRVHASAGVWLGVLTTIVTLVGSLVLLKGGSLVTEVTTNFTLQVLLLCLVCLVFLVAVLALLAGAIATWGGLWDLSGQAQAQLDSDPKWRRITRVAHRLAFIGDPPTDSSQPVWAVYRHKYGSNAERSRTYLHASRTLGGIAAGLVGLAAVAAMVVGTLAPPPTYVLVVYRGMVTCSTTENTNYPPGVTQVTPVDSCKLPGRNG